MVKSKPINFNALHTQVGEAGREFRLSAQTRDGYYTFKYLDNGEFFTLQVLGDKIIDKIDGIPYQYKSNGVWLGKGGEPCDEQLEGFIEITDISLFVELSNKSKKLIKILEEL